MTNKTVRPFYIKYETFMTDGIVQDVLDKAIKAGAKLDECVRDLGNGIARFTSDWKYFGVDIYLNTIFWDDVKNFSMDDAGEDTGEATLITLDQVDYFLEHGCVPPLGFNWVGNPDTPLPEATRIALEDCDTLPEAHTTCENKTSPSSNTIVSDEDNNVSERLSDNPLEEAVAAIDKVLESSSPMYSLQGLTSLTTAHPLMSFTFINGRCELEYNETIYNVDKDKDVWDIVEAIKTLDKYKSEES